MLAVVVGAITLIWLCTVVRDTVIESNKRAQPEPPRRRRAR